jgi:hypothetical protein
MFAGIEYGLLPVARDGPKPVRDLAAEKLARRKKVRSIADNV